MPPNTGTTNHPNPHIPEANPEREETEETGIGRDEWTETAVEGLRPSGEPLTLGGRRITGVSVAYLHVCPRKLWLFLRQIEMEETSELVQLARLIHEQHYQRRRTNLLLAGSIRLDFIETGKAVVVHEVKKSKRLEPAHLHQLAFYLYYLRLLGIQASGLIHYPLTRQTQTLNLTPQLAQAIERDINEIRRIDALPTPPPRPSRAPCRRCAYHDFCHT